MSKARAVQTEPAPAWHGPSFRQEVGKEHETGDGHAKHEARVDIDPDQEDRQQPVSGSRARGLQPQEDGHRREEQEETQDLRPDEQAEPEGEARHEHEEDRGHRVEAAPSEEAVEDGGKQEEHEEPEQNQAGYPGGEEDQIEEDVREPGVLDPFAARGGEGEGILGRQRVGRDVQLPLLQVEPGVEGADLEEAQEDQVGDQEEAQDNAEEPLASRLQSSPPKRAVL